MDRDLPAGSSTRPPLIGWRRCLPISLLLVVAYAFCYFIVPKIEASWKSPGPRQCYLRLMPSVKDVSGIPTAGDSLIIVADVDHVLHFRIFDGYGKVVVDTDETKLPAQAQRIKHLKKLLESLWPPQRATSSERVWINGTITTLVGYTWSQTPEWVFGLAWLSHLFILYVHGIVLVLTVFVVLRCCFSAANAKPRRLQFGLGTVLVTVAVVAVTIAMFNAWLLAPYQAEHHAVAALRRKGGKFIMVDDAPKWLRSYVGKDIFNIEVASFVNLSHSRVTDSDLVYLLAFRHYGQINLSDTQISDAGLTYLIKLPGRIWLDLSRTRVTDLSVLLGGRFANQLASLKLSGNRIAGNRIAPFEKVDLRWSLLSDLDLCDSDADDGTLAELPDGLDNLINLDLSGTNVSDDGLLSLLRMLGLVKLDLRDTKVTATGVARLKSRWRYARPPTILTGTKKKVAGTPKSRTPRGTSGGSAAPMPLQLEGDVPAAGSRRS